VKVAKIKAATKRKRAESSVERTQSPRTRKKKCRYECSTDGCKNQAQKDYRYECSADGCTNVVISGGVRVKHGAKTKRCSTEGCTNQAKKGGVCITHGAKVKRCSINGCTNKVQKGGVCKRHMVQRLHAALMDVQITLSKEECALGMVQTAVPPKYLPHTHSIQNLTRLLQL
jgi:hypothetical protein